MSSHPTRSNVATKRLDTVLVLALLVLAAVLAADCLQSISVWLHQITEHPPAVALLKALMEIRGVQ